MAQNPFLGLPSRMADAITTVETVADLPTGVQEGAVRYVKDEDVIYAYNGSSWEAVSSDPNTVIGPGSSTDNAIVRWDGATGTLVQDSTVTMSDTGDVDGVDNLTANNVTIQTFAGDMALVSDAGGVVSESTVSTTELEYLSGVTSSVQDQLDAKVDDTEKGAAGGVATLDGGGKVPVAQLPSTVMEYQGAWDASTNTPTLADGAGNNGDTYRASVAGTQNLGSGAQTWAIGDLVIYNGSIWQKAPAADGVSSVNGYTGAVVLTAPDIAGLTAGSVAFAGASGELSQDNSNFFWDDTNNRLGIRSSSPASTLELRAATSENYLGLKTLGGTDLLNVVYDGAAVNFVGNSNLLQWYGFTGGISLFNETTAYGGLRVNRGSTSQALWLDPTQYATVGTPLTASTMKMSSFAWNGSDGFTLFSESSLKLTQLSAATNSARLDVSASTAGTAQLSLLSSGNFGVNNSNPTELFTVGSGAGFRVDNSGNAIANTVSIEDTSSAFRLLVECTSSNPFTANRTLTLAFDDTNTLFEVLGDLSIGGNLTTNDALSLVMTGPTTVSLPTSGTLATLAGTESLSNKTLGTSNTLNILDTLFEIWDNGDNSKRFKFDATAISASTTRTYGVPNADTTLVGTNVSQTLTNKTIDADSNTITNIEDADIKSSANIAGSKIAAATSSTTGTVSREDDGAEGDIGTVTVAGTWTPDSKKFKYTQVGKRVDLWFRLESASPGTTVTQIQFQLPGACPTPSRFSTTGSGEIQSVGEASGLSNPGTIPTGTDDTATSFLYWDGTNYLVYVTMTSVSARLVVGSLTYYV